jgi:hypothetical protein
MGEKATAGPAQACYTTAYFVLPQYAFNDPARLLAEFGKDPDYAARFFYVMACQAASRSPQREEVAAITGHTGRLNDEFNYSIVQFPAFPPVNLTDLPPDKLMAAMERVVLAPYFAAVLTTSEGAVAHYFVLGQSPNGGTTLREVTPKMNANLGPGCQPRLGDFIASLAGRLRPGATPSPPIAGIRLDERPAAPPKRWWQFWR